MMIGWLAPQSDGWINPVWLTLAAVGDEWEMEESIERAWLARTWVPKRVRQRFHVSVLEAYPLTQPPDICSRCHRWTGDGDLAWDLDHIVELQFGGLDHPSNLIRLCRPCHQTKPLPPEALWDDDEGMRRYALAWVRRGPRDGRREPWPDPLSDHLQRDPVGSADVHGVQR